MNSIKIGFVSILVAFGGLNGNVIAFEQTGTVQVNQQAQNDINKPRHGLSMQQVESQYGAPQARSPAVGEPPITRWVYGNFTVYFEHDIVIHTVAHRA